MPHFFNEMLKDKVLPADVTGSVLYSSHLDSRKGLAFSQWKLPTSDRFPERDIVRVPEMHNVRPRTIAFRQKERTRIPDESRRMNPRKHDVASRY
jgi:hypothetical protein